MFRENLLVFAFAFVSSELTDEWIPSDNFSNSTSVDWFSSKHENKSIYARNFHDDDLEAIDRAFNEYNTYNGELTERDDYKAIPFQVEPVQNGNANNPVHFHTTIFPQNLQNTQTQTKPFYSVPQTAYTNPVYSAPLNYQPGYQSYQPPVQNLENFDSYLPPPVSSPFTDNVTNLELNARHLLYLQPGKCSNSIEVVRIRDLEIKSAYKYGTDNNKAVCILMLYSANERNKLAISMQAVTETVSTELATESWLQRNLKIYSLNGAAIVQTPIDVNFGVGSPALILTKSSIVLLSINADRSLDFQMDISTYQSPTC